MGERQLVPNRVKAHLEEREEDDSGGHLLVSNERADEPEEIRSDEIRRRAEELDRYDGESQRGGDEPCGQKEEPVKLGRLGQGYRQNLWTRLGPELVFRGGAFLYQGRSPTSTT